MDDIRNPSAPPDKSRKYALRERERRFLLTELPAGEIVRIVLLTDNYLLGTRLRLRRWVETAAGATTTVYKFTQKVPAADGAQGLISTFYLNAEEYEALAVLPSRQLRKTRHSIPPYAVDVFDPPLHGLILAEVEFTSDEALRAFAPPAFARAEVTHDPRFTGGHLAACGRDELLRALATFGVHPVESPGETPRG